MGSKWMTRLLILVVVGVILWGFNALWTDAAQPTIGTQLAVANVNGGNTEWQEMNVFQKNKGLVGTVSFILFGLTAVVLFVPMFRKKSESSSNNGVSSAIIMIFACATIVAMTGCRKPYDVPEFVEVGNNQTAFVVPLEGDTKAQAKFNSVEYLEALKVGTKRIQIPHRWNQTGRLSNDGKWIPTVKVILVDRTPVTREWVAEKNKATAIWTESCDSIGFSMGWNGTAFVKEENTATFLYWYPSGSLAAVMDEEIRGKIQESVATYSAKVKIDLLREQKAEMAIYVKDLVVPFFEKRGITITTLGQCAGMTYDNDKIQQAIDATFITQQEKVNAKAMLEAQEDKNKRIKSEAEALAEAARTKAKGEADGNLSKFLAEAQGIEAINKAIAQANNNPQLVQLKSIEVEKARVEKWNGMFPTTVVGEGSNTWVGLQQASQAFSAQSSGPASSVLGPATSTTSVTPKSK